MRSARMNESSWTVQTGLAERASKVDALGGRRQRQAVDGDGTVQR